VERKRPNLWWVILPALLFHQWAIAQAPAMPNLNESFNDAWFNPATPGQGFSISVFPENQSLFLAWFTFETERPAAGPDSVLGEVGHRWLTAFGTFEGNHAELDIELTRGGVFESGIPAVSQQSVGAISVTFESCRNGTLVYNMPALGLQGAIPIQRVSGSNVPRCESLLPQVCADLGSDPSHGVDNPQEVNGAIVPVEQIVDGGPGPDGIPAVENPIFTRNFSATNILPDDLVIGVRLGEETRAYTHNVMWWHEVVNDSFIHDGESGSVSISHCPLTGTSMLWDAPLGATNKTYGVSGLLYNSNLIMYDRETGSLWSQMLEQSIAGSGIRTIPERRQVIETTWATWLAMYPETRLLTENTGWLRNYRRYPYGRYRQHNFLIFAANNMDDTRLHRKERVVGINMGDYSKVYPINGFTSQIEVINDTADGVPVVVAGSSDLNFGVIYIRKLPSCTELEFEPVQDRLPVIMRDNEGNEWDVFGQAVNGPRTGQQLRKTNSYVSYWFAWTAFFANTQIHP
jgi:hypothetical protein